MRRVCFTLQVRPERLAEYRARHAAVWPDLELVFDLDAQLGAIGEPTTASTGDTP